MKRKEFYALGIMSGTSADGLDFSIIKSDGKEKVQIIENKYFKFIKEFKIKIINFFGGFKKKKLQTLEKSYFFKDFNKFYTLYLIKKIKQFFLSCNFKKYKIDLIGIHGNTIIHKPSKNKSIQLVDPHLIFNQFNKP